MSFGSKIDKRIQAALIGTTRQSASQISATQQKESVTGTIESTSGVTAIVALGSERRKCNLGTKSVRPGDSVVVIGTRIL